MAWNRKKIAHQMQTFLMQGDVQPPQIIYLNI